MSEACIRDQNAAIDGLKRDLLDSLARIASLQSDLTAAKEEIERLKAHAVEVEQYGWKELLRKREDELSAAKERCERAEAVVAKLPKTADGVTIVPGMKLFSLSEWTAVMRATLVYEGTIEDNSHIDCMYSTRTAALASPNPNLYSVRRRNSKNASYNWVSIELVDKRYLGGVSAVDGPTIHEALISAATEVLDSKEKPDEAK